MDPERIAAKPRPQPMEDREEPSSSSKDSWGTYFLGPYRVVDEIGVGGMATVELARMDGAGGFQKWVAIKRIHPHLTEDQQFINMFLDEARIAASISHPNVAQVFDLGKDGNTYWIAMEYLHGEPLREIMRINEESETSIQPEVAARMIAEAAEGLHAAHELRGKDRKPLNLVHRDVTPHNLFITYEGVVKVVDFGIAKVTDSLSSTHAGTIKGKIAYMSPEQVRGKAIDRRADIFSLGVVLWEMTTGRRLFRVESDLATLSRVEACAVPPPSVFDSDYPMELESVLLKALQREPKDRYQTAREFSRALQKFLMGSRVFVGPEDISAYLKGMFGDRVLKREAHLRWAAEVTQTVSIHSALTQEDSGDLLDLSKLPHATGESDSIEFDTIQDRPAPKVQGVPSPLGWSDIVQRSNGQQAPGQQAPGQQAPGQQAPGQQAPGQQAPGQQAPGQHDVDRKLSATEAVAIPAGPPVQMEDDDDDDDAATLVATSPIGINSAMASLGMQILRDSPGGRAPTANEKAGLPPAPQPTDRVYVQPWESNRISSADASGPHPGIGPHGRPVFDIHSSPMARTMQLPTVRRGADPWVVFAAAVGAGFVAAGLGAIWFVKSRASAAYEQPVPTVTEAVSSSADASLLDIVAIPSTAPIPEDSPRLDQEPSPPKDTAKKTAKGGQGTGKAVPKQTATNEALIKALPEWPAEEGNDAIRPGFISVRCNPECDRIVAGGQSFTGSVTRAPLAPGQYRIQCIRGETTKILSSIIVSGEHNRLQIKMD